MRSPICQYQVSDTTIDIASLTSNEFYYVRARFTLGDLSGTSKLSQKFWYGNSDPPIDLTPPSMDEVDDGIWEVYYGPIRLGQFDIRNVSGQNTKYWSLKM